jgi:hypothetical protein
MFQRDRKFDVIRERSLLRRVRRITPAETPNGIGDDHYPLPWQSLKYDTGLGGYIAGVTKRQLEGVPKYSNDNAWNWSDASRSRAVNDYYGIPYVA